MSNVLHTEVCTVYPKREEGSEESSLQGLEWMQDWSGWSTITVGVGDWSVGLCQGDTPLVLFAVFAVGWSAQLCFVVSWSVVCCLVLGSAVLCSAMQCNAVSKPLNHTARIHG